MKYSIRGDAEVKEKNVADAQEETKEFVVCDVCGFANKPEDALCKQCSNYLYGGEGKNVL